MGCKLPFLPGADMTDPPRHFFLLNSDVASELFSIQLQVTEVVLG